MNESAIMVAFCTTWQINSYVLRPVPLKFWQLKTCFSFILFSSNMLLAVTEMLQYVCFSDQAKKFFVKLTSGQTSVRSNISKTSASVTET